MGLGIVRIALRRQLRLVQRRLDIGLGIAAQAQVYQHQVRTRRQHQGWRRTFGLAQGNGLAILALPVCFKRPGMGAQGKQGQGQDNEGFACAHGLDPSKARARRTGPACHSAICMGRRQKNGCKVRHDAPGDAF